MLRETNIKSVYFQNLLLFYYKLTEIGKEMAQILKVKYRGYDNLSEFILSYDQIMTNYDLIFLLKVYVKQNALSEIKFN